MRPQATPVVHIDDERFKVTEWRFAANAETGWHVHGHDYVIVPLTDGVLRLEEPGGCAREATLARHEPYSRRAGVEHNVINGSAGHLSFLEVEVVNNALAATRLAVLDRMIEAWNARDVAGLMACMSENCTFHAGSGVEAEGARHVGQVSVRKAFQSLLEAFPEAVWTDVQHSVAGDLGVSRWRFRGRDAEGRAQDIDGCHLLTFVGERIALKSSFWKCRTSEPASGAIGL